MRPGVVVELGIWCGRSLVPMALALKHIGAGKIIGIDPWDTKASVKGITGEDLKWWSEVDHEKIFTLFNQWMKDLNLGAVTEIHRCRSDQFDHTKLPLIDLLHIDGNHGDEASVYDVTHYASQVRVGGFCYFDDIAWAKKAAEMLPGMGFQRLYIIDGGMMCQRLNYEIA
jgi:predicted O-methyltransferase YrrM